MYAYFTICKQDLVWTFSIKLNQLPEAYRLCADEDIDLNKQLMCDDDGSNDRLQATFYV